MAAALERLHTDVLSGEAVHDGDPRVARHVANAHREVRRAANDRDGRRVRVLIRKETPESPDKIDGAVTATLAYEARADALAAGVPVTVEPEPEYAQVFSRR